MWTSKTTKHCWKNSEMYMKNEKLIRLPQNISNASFLPIHDFFV